MVEPSIVLAAVGQLEGSAQAVERRAGVQATPTMSEKTDRERPVSDPACSWRSGRPVTTTSDTTAIDIVGPVSGDTPCSDRLDRIFGGFGSDPEQYCVESMRAMRLILWGLIAAAFLAGCGGDSGEAADDDGGGALAHVTQIDERVDVRLGEARDFAEVGNETQLVKLGDAVRTDGSGFAEVRYFDGSLTRLDVDTEFTVVELSDAPGASLVRTDMGLGQTWHRVQELAGDDRYEVETSVATAVVRGTAFVIHCPSPTECTFTVLEGTIDVVTDDETVTLESGESVTVADGEVETPVSVSGSPLEDDAWLARNAALDTDAGFDQLPLDADDSEENSLEGFEGTYVLEFTNAELLEASGACVGASVTLNGGGVLKIDCDRGIHTHDLPVEPVDITCSDRPPTCSFTFSSAFNGWTGQPFLDGRGDEPRLISEDFCSGEHSSEIAEIERRTDWVVVSFRVTSLVSAMECEYRVGFDVLAERVNQPSS